MITIDRNLKKSKNVLYKMQIENIRSAASMWMTDNIELIPSEGYYTLLLSHLQSEGYIESTIENSKVNEIFNPITIIKIGMKNILIDDEIKYKTDKEKQQDYVLSEINLINTNASKFEDGIYYYDLEGNLEHSGYVTNINTYRNYPFGNILISNGKVINACLNYGDTNYEYHINKFIGRNLSCSTIRGENLVINGDLSYGNNTNFEKLKYDNENYLTRTSSSRLNFNNSDFIPVDVNKKYEMGVSTKCNNTSSTHFIGFKSYDVDKKSIEQVMFVYVSGTLTNLSRDLNDGDEYIYLNNMDNWLKVTSSNYNRGFIFWNYKDSTGYEYLENTYSRNVWYNLYSDGDIETNIEIDGKITNRIKLTKPWDKGFIPKGTKLSQSNYYNAYTFNYNLRNGQKYNTDFTIFSKFIDGVIDDGKKNHNKFRPGTKFIQIVVFDNYNNKPDTTTYYKDFYIREIID